MLKINPANDSITLTKGDSGIITITLDGLENNNTGLLGFYVRNALNLDDVIFKIEETDETIFEEPGNTTVSNDIGTIEPQSEILNGRKSWTLKIYPNATKDLRRKTYYYDFKLINDVDTDVVTFKGGDTKKCEFIIT